MLIRIETRAGHGGGKPTSKRIDEVTDHWAFLVKNLGMKLPGQFRQAVELELPRSHSMSNIHGEERKIDRRTCLQGVVGAAVGLVASQRLAVGSPKCRQRRGSAARGQEIRDPLTLEQSLRLAGQNLLGILDPDDNYLPYWELTVQPDYRRLWESGGRPTISAAGWMRCCGWRKRSGLKSPRWSRRRW